MRDKDIRLQTAARCSASSKVKQALALSLNVACRQIGIITYTLSVFCWFAIAATGQHVDLGDEAYLSPPNPILEQVTQPWHLNQSMGSLSPDGTKYLVSVSDGLTPIARLAAPYVRLGESSLDHIALRSRSLTTRNNAGYRVHDYLNDQVIEIPAPEGARVTGGEWSPDGSAIMFLAHFPEGTYVYRADSQSGESSRLLDERLMATYVTGFDWTLDGTSIAVVLPPEGAEAPIPADVANEPKVRVARNGANPSRTYRFLLDSPEDMDLLEFLATGQLALINTSNGQVERIGEPGMFVSNSMSPNGDYFRASVMKRPFSYYDPTSAFGRSEDLYDRNGEIIHNFSERELGQRGARGQGGSPQDDERSRENRRRDLRWRPDGAGISFLQMEPEADDEAEEGDADAGNADSDNADSDAADTDDSDQADEDSDEGEEEEPKRKDRVMLWVAPYGEDDVEEVYASETAISQVQYSEDCRMIFLTQSIDERRTITAIDLDNPEETYLVYQIASDDENDEGANQGGARRGRGARGGNRPQPANGDDSSPGQDDPTPSDPDDDAEEPKKRGASEGTLMTRSTIAGDSIVRVSDNGDVFFSGTTSEDDESDDESESSMPKPFIDRVNIISGEVSRVYEGDGTMLERIVGVDTDNVQRVFVTKEMREVVQDLYRFEVEADETIKMTENVNYAPWYQELERVRFQVERVDGIKFWVTAYRSREYGDRLPAMFWFYPREYDGQEAYDRSQQRTQSSAFRERFGRPSTRSMTHLTQIGYVVVEPDCPIIGESGQWNDNFIPDLRNNLWAVIDAMDEMGWIDRQRLGLGGHSYGAFGTANAMAHTPFFKAGIAGDGNFNRSLTPMGFQREPRHLWNAREIYTGMSPLLWADQIHGALLMYHGIEDPNVGTWPIHSERMFQALDGIGRPSSLYMYPYEEHGPVGLETQLDMWARWVEWLDIYVKHPEKGKALAEQDSDEDDDSEEFGSEWPSNQSGDYDIYGYPIEDY